MSSTNNRNWKGGISWAYKFKTLSCGRKKPEQCEICGAIGKVCLDHNHKTGEFRGWICHRCNLALGLFKDNIGLLKATIEYLSKNNNGETK